MANNAEEECNVEFLRGNKSQCRRQEMVEEDFVDGSEPIASATLREEEKTVMIKLVKTMATLFSIYDIDYRNLKGEHGLVVGEDLSGKVDFVLSDIPYNVLRDPNDDHSQYDVFGSTDTKNMAKIFGDVINPGVLGHAFCSALQFALCLKPFASRKVKERHSNREDSSKDGSQCEEGESVELVLEFAMEHSAPLYFLQVRTISKKRLRSVQRKRPW